MKPFATGDIEIHASRLPGYLRGIAIDVYRQKITQLDTGYDRGIEHLAPDPENKDRYVYEEHGLLAESVIHTFRLGNTEAQTLIDTLWQAGLRPSEGTGSAGALAATQRHLEDMRKLVFRETPNA